MKLKLLIACVMVSVLCMDSSADFSDFFGPSGSMDVYEYTGTGAGNFQFGSSMGLEDLQSKTTDNRTFELLPNISLYSDYPGDPYWDNGAGDGNKWMVATTYFERLLDGSEAGISFSFDVDAYDLDPRYEVLAFVKVVDLINYTFAPLAIDQVVLTSPGSHTLSIDTLGMSGQLIEVGWTMSGLNANPADDWGSTTVTATDLSVIPEPGVIGLMALSGGGLVFVRRFFHSAC